MRVSWPSMSDYQEAVQNPSTAFFDPQLRTGVPVCDALGLPKPITGGFASVYQIKCGGTKWAVRCFLRHHEDTEERYACIGEHLGRIRLPYTAQFDYLKQGIRIKGVSYPVLKMEWVEGDPLNAYVEKHLGDRKTLESLAGEFLRMVGKLRANGVAHGDLQHGNILVVDGKLRLVDYDGMYVPGLSGRKSHELGHPNYQHPKRTQVHFGPYLDSFSGWVIYLSILALCIKPDLWSLSGSGDERLLLSGKDFRDPDSSKVLCAMKESSDEFLRDAAGALTTMLSVGDIAAISPATPLKEGALVLPVLPSSTSRPEKGAWWKDFEVRTHPPSEAPVGKAAAPVPEWLSAHVQPQPVELRGPFKVERVCFGGWVAAAVATAFRLGVAAVLASWGIRAGLLAVVYVCAVRYRACYERREKVLIAKALRQVEAGMGVREKAVAKLQQASRLIDMKENRDVKTAASKLQTLMEQEAGEIKKVDEWRQRAQDDLVRERAEIDRREKEGLDKLAAQVSSPVTLLRAGLLRNHYKKRRNALAQKEAQLSQAYTLKRKRFEDTFEALKELLLEGLNERQKTLAKERDTVNQDLSEHLHALNLLQADLARLKGDHERYKKVTFLNYLRGVVSFK